MAKSSKAPASLKGQLLLAGAGLVDPNFARTVVLMVQHDENGALGLVLNRATQTAVKEVCDQVLEVPCEIGGVLYQGGPCEGPLMVVHSHPLGGQVEIVPGVYLSTDRDEVERLFASGHTFVAHDEGAGDGIGKSDEHGPDPDSHGAPGPGATNDATVEPPRIKCFVGYAGWAAGQLEAEMETGSWLTTPADISGIFDMRSSDQWNKLVTRVTLGTYIDPRRIPEDPNVN